MFEYLFSSVDGPCMTHDAQRTITPLKIIGEFSHNNMSYSTSYSYYLQSFSFVGSKLWEELSGNEHAKKSN